MHTFLSSLLQQQQERTTTMTSMQWSILSKWTCKRSEDIRHSTRVTLCNRRLLCLLATGSILFLSALLLIIHHSPTQITQTWLPVQELSQKYRNWTYYVGPLMDSSCHQPPETLQDKPWWITPWYTKQRPLSRRIRQIQNDF